MEIKNVKKKKLKSLSKFHTIKHPKIFLFFHKSPERVD